MDEREKIINIIQSVKYCEANNSCDKCKYDKELDNYKDMSCGTLKAADALIAANIGDVTEWKERAEKEKAEKNKWKCTANDWKQRFESREKQLIELQTTSCEVLIRKDKVISEQKAEIARLTAENTELRARLDKAVEPQFSNGDEVYAIMDTLFYTGVFPVTIKSADVVYEVFDGEQTTTQHRTRIFTTRAAAEARLKELQGGER